MGNVCNQVKSVIYYQVKLLGREWMMRLFSLLVLVGIPVIIKLLVYISWVSPYAFSASIPCEVSCVYEFLQSLFVIFMANGMVVRDTRCGSREVIYARPVSNMAYIGGKMLGMLVFFVGLNVIVLCIGACIQVEIGESAVKPWMYVFYLFTLSFPSLCFWLGVTSLVGCVVRNKSRILLLLLLFGAYCFYLYHVRHGVFHYSVRGVANVFSDMTGHPCLGLYLLHRCCYLFLGVGFGILSITGFRRMENHKRLIYRAVWGGSACLLVGIIAGWKYDRFFVERDARRAEYRMAYMNHAGAGSVQVSEHSIECRQEADSLYAKSCLTVQNRSGEDVTDFILYLNPWLRVNEIVNNGVRVSFERDQQVIIVKNPLMPGEKIVLEMSYAGRVDEAFCYLELDDVAYDTREFSWKIRFLMNPFFCLGQRYAFLSEKFTLLYPECSWYPSAVAPENIKVPLARKQDYTRYSLRVGKKEGRMIISQGRRQDTGEQVLFENWENLSGISLCIGDFGLWSLKTDSLNLELYVSAERNSFMEKLDIPKEKQLKVLEEELDFWKRLCSRNYLFRDFKVVECPFPFAVHQRKWNLSNNSIQSAMVFWPERAITLSISGFEQFPEAWFWTNVTYMRSSGMYSISPMFVDFAGTVADDRYPGIDRLLNSVLKLEHLIWDISLTPDLLKGVRYLSRNSLREAFADDQLAPEVLSEMVSLNAWYLKGFLSVRTAGNDFRLFLNDFFERHRFENIEFETLQREYWEKFGVDLEPVISDIYARKGLPWFRIDDAKYMVLENGTGHGRDSCLYEFKVFNDSDVDGVIALQKGVGEIFMEYDNFIVPARACKKIRFVLPFCFDQLELHARLSRNLPDLITLNLKKGNLTEKTSGVFDCDTSAFVSPENEIIVDDRDEGFSLINAANEMRWTDLFRAKEEIYLCGGNIFCTKIWTFYIRREFYGDPVRGAWFKLPGTGKSKAVWLTRLKKGKYEVFVHVPESFSSTVPFREYVKGKVYHYTICCSGKEIEAPLELEENTKGWVSLGEYAFDEGEASVTLDDRVETDGMKVDGNKRIAAIFADAVKWKRVKE